MNKTKKRIKGLLFALLYIVIYIAISLIVQLTYIITINISHPSMSKGEILDRVLDGTFALNVISCVLAMWIYMIISKIRKKPLNTIIKNEKIPPILTLMSVCCAIGSRLLVNVYLYLAESISPLKRSIEASTEISPDIINGKQALVAVFLMVIVAPVFEEFLFRGLVMNEFMEIMRPWAAITLQGILFGITHMALFQSIFAGVLGILIGVIYYNTKSIKMACVFHCVFNLSAVLTATNLSNPTAILILVLGLLLSGVSLFYILVYSKK